MLYPARQFMGGRGDIHDFLEESFRIEGIYDQVSEQQITHTEEFLRLNVITIGSLLKLVRSYTGKDHILRDRPGLNVIVGGHIPPGGGPEVRERLEDLLRELNSFTWKTRNPTPYEMHCKFEWLHPFTDGNGRVGRTLFLWDKLNRDTPVIPFLHFWYYDSLKDYEERKRRADNGEP
jgi:hypothetical protein